MITQDPCKITQEGLLLSHPFYPSPHCDDRPQDSVIDMIVIHGISLPPGEFETGEIKNFFCGHLNYGAHPYFETIISLKVSAHLLIERRGKVMQFVPFVKRAWHAGVSSFKGQINCNDFSIGIELEGTDDLPYEKIQYEKLANLIQLLMKTYPLITKERVVGHAEIAPGRKTDPGLSFDWSYLYGLLEGTTA